MKKEIKKILTFSGAVALNQACGTAETTEVKNVRTEKPTREELNTCLETMRSSESATEDEILQLESLLNERNGTDESFEDIDFSIFDFFSRCESLNSTLGSANLEGEPV